MAGEEHGTGDADATGYVHDPATFDDEGERAGEDHPATGDREFDWRGWLLVGWLVVALVVVPVALYFLPRASGFAASLGLGLRDAYLVLPLIPALVLGALAVWATTRP